MQGSWIVRQSVGSTPCLLGKAIDCNYIRGPNYLEVLHLINLCICLQLCINFVPCVLIKPCIGWCRYWIFNSRQWSFGPCGWGDHNIGGWYGLPCTGRVFYKILGLLLLWSCWSILWVLGCNFSLISCRSFNFDVLWCQIVECALGDCLNLRFW